MHRICLLMLGISASSQKTPHFQCALLHPVICCFLMIQFWRINRLSTSSMNFLPVIGKEEVKKRNTFKAQLTFGQFCSSHVQIFARRSAFRKEGFAPHRQYRTKRRGRHATLLSCAPRCMAHRSLPNFQQRRNLN